MKQYIFRIHNNQELDRLRVFLAFLGFEQTISYIPSAAYKDGKYNYNKGSLYVFIPQVDADKDLTYTVKYKFDIGIIHRNAFFSNENYIFCRVPSQSTIDYMLNFILGKKVYWIVSLFIIKNNNVSKNIFYR